MQTGCARFPSYRVAMGLLNTLTVSHGGQLGNPGLIISRLILKNLHEEMFSLCHG